MQCSVVVAQSVPVAVGGEVKEESFVELRRRTEIWLLLQKTPEELHLWQNGIEFETLENNMCWRRNGRQDMPAHHIHTERVSQGICAHG